MSTPAVDGKVASPLYRTERVIASLTMAWVIILTTYMIFQDHALSHTSIYFLKIILALSGAVMLATLPGFFDVNYSIGGFSVRAAGGAAAFVFIYTQSPHLPTLNAADAQTPPPARESQPPPAPTPLSSRADGFPVLMALSISPASLLPAPAHTNYQGISIEAGTESGSAGAGIGAGAQRMSIGEAVRTDISAFAATVVSYVRSGLQRVKTWLDIAAQRFRSGIDGLLAIAKDLLGLAPLADTSPQLIGVLQEDGLPAQLDDLTGSLLDTATQPVGALLINLNQLSSSLLGGLSDTAGGVVAITDHSVGALLTTVQDTTHGLLEGTNTLVHGTTALLNSTTGDLTSGLTAPIDGLTSGVTSATADLVNGAAPKVAATASGVLQSVNAGLTQVTNGINAISPSIVSQIDPDMIAAQDLPNLLDVGDLGDLPSLPMNVGTTANRLTDGLGGGGDHGLLAANKAPILQGLIGAGDSGQSVAEPLCISGCAGSAGPLVSGLRDTVGSLGTGRLLGGLGAGSTDSGGIASSGGGPLAGPVDGAGEPSGGGGGLVSSTVKTTGSLVGGVTKSLRRR
jgi:hypothetical protein